jgi:hypothetical protein
MINIRVMGLNPIMGIATIESAGRLDDINERDREKHKISLIHYVVFVNLS